MKNMERKTVSLDETLALKMQLLQQELFAMQLAQQLKQRDLAELERMLRAEYEEDGKYKIVDVNLNKLEVVLEAQSDES